MWTRWPEDVSLLSLPRFKRSISAMRWADLSSEIVEDLLDAPCESVRPGCLEIRQEAANVVILLFGAFKERTKRASGDDNHEYATGEDDQ
ncbi:hypothetical protein ACJRO7_035678 [Eucalyptus globulus]|uniref:Uncharacterized protein n=1 Tax=Eucalyptus globulus TaxID=34317 RepID=A0ABD3J6W0_EUCGL